MTTPLKLLLVEDSDDDAQLVVRELTRGSFDVVHRRVDTEPSLVEALREPWDVVISDFAMPAFDGLRAFETVRGVAPELPFLFVSGVLGEARAVEAMRAGARDYLVKGDLARLCGAVRRELRESEHRRKRSVAERALEVEERRFRSIFESATVGIVETDLSGMRNFLASLAPDGAALRVHAAKDSGLAVRAAERVRVLAANRAALRMLGADDVGDPTTALGLLEIPAARAAFVDVLEAVLDGAGSYEKEIEIRTPGGRTVSVLLSLRLPSAPADLEHVVASLIDVTERRGLEQRMQSVLRLETVGRLAGGVAHDFNNILVVIGVNASFLLDRHPTGSPEREEVLAIRDAGERAARLTRQLLTFSRRQPQQARRIDVNEVVREMEGMLRRLINEDIVLSTELDPGLDTVRLDPTQLEQVVMNLAVNARDAMPRGGRLTMQTANVVLEPGEVQGEEESAGRWVRLSVVDNGSGMDEETRLRIFEPFFTTKEAGQGTGLGLSTVYGIVRQNGGFVRVRSWPGRGSVFEIYFPPAAAGREGRPSSQSVVPRPTGTETILLVEDEASVRRVARRILEEAGYAILEARDAVDAISVAAAHEGPIHLVVTDVVMPGLSGPELVERLLATRPATRVLYISGYASDAVLQRGVAEAASHLEKPFTPDALARRVREVLEAGPTTRDE